MTESTQTFSEAAIIGRTIETSNDNVSPDLAEHTLALTISKADQQRVDDLLEDSEADTLSERETDKLANLK